MFVFYSPVANGCAAGFFYKHNLAIFPKPSLIVHFFAGTGLFFLVFWGKNAFFSKIFKIFPFFS